MKLKEIYPHLSAILFFLIITITYLSPVLNGLSLKQDDINNHKGVSKEIKDHREEYNEEPLWTNSMFGGMPATQISVKHDANLLSYAQKIMTFGFDSRKQISIRPDQKIFYDFFGELNDDRFELTKKIIKKFN